MHQDAGASNLAYLAAMLDGAGAKPHAAAQTDFSAPAPEATDVLRSTLLAATVELEASQRRCRAAAATLMSSADGTPVGSGASPVDELLKRCRSLLVDSVMPDRRAADALLREAPAVPPAAASNATVPMGDAAVERQAPSVGEAGLCGQCWRPQPTEADAVAASRRGHSRCCAALLLHLHGCK